MEQKIWINPIFNLVSFLCSYSPFFPSLFSYFYYFLPMTLIICHKELIEIQYQIISLLFAFDLVQFESKMLCTGANIVLLLKLKFDLFLKLKRKCVNFCFCLLLYFAHLVFSWSFWNYHRVIMLFVDFLFYSLLFW